MRSSLGQLKDFMESTIWADILEESSTWLEQIRDELENPVGDMSTRMLDRLGGCALGVRNFHMIVEVLMGLAEDATYKRDEARRNLERGGKNG